MKLYIYFVNLYSYYSSIYRCCAILTVDGQKWNAKILTGAMMGYFKCGDTTNGPIWALTLDVSIGELVPQIRP
jgi:hypothetical protein